MDNRGDFVQWREFRYVVLLNTSTTTITFDKAFVGVVTFQEELHDPVGSLILLYSENPYREVELYKGRAEFRPSVLFGQKYNNNTV